MCHIRILVIGNSSLRNHDAIQRVKAECRSFGEDIQVDTEMVSPYTPGIVNPDDHDLALVDESVISKGCSKVVLGSGLPVLTFGDLSESHQSLDVTDVLSGVVGEAVRIGRFRDYIEMVTDHIDATRQMIVASA